MFLENRELVGYGNVSINSPLYQDKSFIKTLLGGDFGLAKTFWMYLSLIAVFINIGMLMSATLSTEILSVLIFLGCTVYAIPLHIGMWRAANKYRGPKIWAILVKLNVKIHLFAFIWAVIFSGLFIYIDRYLSDI
jgi:hypothetical protein